MNNGLESNYEAYTIVMILTQVTGRVIHSLFNVPIVRLITTQGNNTSITRGRYKLIVNKKMEKHT